MEPCLIVSEVKVPVVHELRIEVELRIQHRRIVLQISVALFVSYYSFTCTKRRSSGFGRDEVDRTASIVEPPALQGQYHDKLSRTWAEADINRIRKSWSHGRIASQNYVTVSRENLRKECMTRNGRGELSVTGGSAKGYTG